jgi:N-acylneuraminate cytidylyltransferase/CMP-N,N'-diacetyllegionaminic acid synthase
MINNDKVLAIIPARAGSKGLPGKNIKMIAGKPLIAWTIEEALKSKIVDKVIVSTDSELIAEIAREYGVEIPFIRPPELATDTAKGIDVIKHAIKFFDNEYDIVIVLQPTSPLRKLENIENAFISYKKLNAKAIVSVCELEHPIQWVGVLPEGLCMAEFSSVKSKNKNRQELKKHYRYNGAIYIADVSYLLQNNGFLGEETYAYIMKSDVSIDIDNLLDFKFAELLLKEKNARYK